MAPNNNKKRNTHGNHRSNRTTTRNPKNSDRRRNNNIQSKRHFGCGICRADHKLTDCRKFIKMNLAEKYKTAIRLHYCVNCLARNHLIRDCRNKTRCQKCKGKHHTILHGPERLLKDMPKDRSSSPPTTSPKPIPAPRRLKPIASTATKLKIPTTMTKTFVPTVIVQVMMEEETQIVRAVLNPSLTTSKIAMSFVKDSWLNPFKIDDDIYVKVLIASNVDSNLHYEICMQVVNDLPKTPYPSAMSDSVKNKVCRISLADPEFYSNTPVAMEIGGDLYTTILQPNVIHIDGGSLIAQDSTLGWLIMGSLNN